MANKSKISHLGEFGLIGQIAKATGTSKDVITSIGDDAAVLPFSRDKYLALTTDMLVEGVHFTRSASPRAVGHKALACSVSDIAAMGGIPKWAVVSLGVPGSLRVDFIKEFYRGMERLARQSGVSIVGGDTVYSKKIVVNVALTGEIRKNQLVLRSGAKKGDMIFVTGPLGRSLKTGKHLHFTPRLKEAQYLVKNFQPTAMIDISDGLAGDLGHIVRESKVGAFVYERLIPKTRGAGIREALCDGEDFELLFTLSPPKANRFVKMAPKPFHFYYIGRIVDKKEKFTLIDSRGHAEAVSFTGFTHF